MEKNKTHQHDAQAPFDFENPHLNLTSTIPISPHLNKSIPLFNFFSPSSSLGRNVRMGRR
ncbi:hypothetical protein Sjap_021609 [Stephania japonica]|uniref:Uncharacterized protein n=1 Tax=Stephania japonica TaxID=461633 RepID=A0AAP0EQF6_9MAGN